MAAKMLLGSCLVAVLGYLAYQELTFVTTEFSLKMLIPAKRSDVFQLLDNPEFYLKVHPLCIGISNVIRSQDEDGHKAVQFDVQDRMVLFGIYESAFSFQVTAKVTQENAEIQNTAQLLSGIFKLKQKWLLTDSENGSEDGTLLEDHVTHTAPLLLARFSKKEAIAAHTFLLENIRQYFKESTTT